MTDSSARQQAFYVLSTHWDREWYQTFQDYRHRLVILLDRVLDEGFRDGKLQGPFQTDGQAIILEDYLEVRPERRAEVEAAARSGKFSIGPWYVLPDEFIVSGESIIRNLALGRATARAFGSVPSQAGFVCDLFGHISQMPQIFANFSIRAGLLWRGINMVDERYVRWVGADGTAMPCFRFAHCGYGDYALKVRQASNFTRRFDLATETPVFEEYVANEAKACGTLPILIFDGSDHINWDPDAYQLITAKLAQDSAGRLWKHGSLDDFLNAVLALPADAIKKEVHGELREPGLRPMDVDQQWLIPGVLSSRVWIKQQNAACQTLLCHWAEPLSALGHRVLGIDGYDGYLNVAWKWLLQNHPHDSICGCSIDAVHADMEYRFRQSHQIAERVALDTSAKLAASIAGEVSDKELRCVVFNSLPRVVDEVAELTLQIPSEWPQFNEFFSFEPKPAFTIHAADGAEIPYQRLDQAMTQWKVRTEPNRHPFGYATHDVRVSLPLQLPALGHTCLTVRSPEPVRPTRYPEEPRLVTSESAMANESLSVVIESNGTLTITDLRSGKVYARCLTFEDVADIGDGWYHGPVVNDERCLSTGTHAEVSIVHDGPHIATFRIRIPWRVPARFDFSQMRRSAERAELLVDTLITLRRGQDRLEFATSIRNTARDHRVRVLFPSGAPATTYLADGAFDVIERPIALRADNHMYRELEVETKPQQTWTAVSAEGRGLAVVAEGLLETSIRDQAERPIALTLFRSTGRTVMTNGEPDGQLLGDLNFRYWLLPLAQAPDRRRLCELGQQLSAGFRAVQMRAADLDIHRVNTSVPALGGAFEVSGSVVLTSLRRVPEGLEVRLFNPQEAPVKAMLDFSKSMPIVIPSLAQPVDFESNPTAPAIPLKGKQLHLEFAPKQIVTLLLKS